MKSQVLKVKPGPVGPDMTVQLDGVNLSFSEVVEYFGLRLTREGFEGKYMEELKAKCTGSFHMLINDPWFNLSLHPKHIARSHQIYVRRILLYGAELLILAEINPLYDLGNKLITTMLWKLLNLRRGWLSARNRWRIQLALFLPSFHINL